MEATEATKPTEQAKQAAPPPRLRERYAKRTGSAIGQE